MSLSEETLVSILINNYNYGRFLGDAIESALAQSYPNVEVIVVDDGSSDNSREVMAGFGSRIKPIYRENGGQASAYNAGFDAANGEIICLLDSDDLHLPDKVATVVKILEGDRRLGWCFDRVRKFHHETGQRWEAADAFAYGRWDFREVTIAGKPPYVATASSGLSFRRRTLARILPMPEVMRIATGCCPDAYLKWIALADEEGWFASEELTLMRIHGTNAFTERVDGKKSLSGQMELLTGLSMYRKCPHLRPLAKKVVARGLGKLRAHGGLKQDMRQQYRSLVGTLSRSERVEISLRTFYWTAFEHLRRG
jgi:glycosyltransferase involved in cell wall biosynthesis